MDNQNADRYSMFFKVLHFLKAKDAELAINPAIIALRGEFIALMNEILQQCVIAEARINGYTEKRDDSRSELIESMLKVSSALFAYWLVAGLKVDLRLGDYSQRELTRKPDGNLYLRATKLHELADPVKALLAPYNCLPADVDTLFDRKRQFFDDVELPKKMRKEKAEARKAVIQLMKQGTVMLKRLDIFMRPFWHGNSTLYSEYLTARAIDKLHRKRRKRPNEQAELQPA